MSQIQRTEYVTAEYPYGEGKKGWSLERRA